MVLGGFCVGMDLGGMGKANRTQCGGIDPKHIVVYQAMIT